MRDLKDYIVQTKEGEMVNPGSPFNIKKDSILLQNFSEQEIAELFAQRTAETGQKITQKALDYIWEQSQGQPWIVNNLFDRATTKILDYESAETVELKHVIEARRQMIEARETHLDALAYRMQDPRIKKIIEVIITGKTDLNMGRENLDVQYTIDLGLVTWTSQKGLYISNPIYTEILTRMVTSGYHDILPPPSNFKWQKPDGSLDMDSLLKEFQKFWRRYSEIWEAKSDYTEAFPHLLLLAFLQRILNGGGDIDREIGAGRGRMDLFVEYENFCCVIELKIWHDYDSYNILLQEALEQVTGYRDHFSKDIPAYLLIFDRRSEAKKAVWEERIKWEEKDSVTVVGL
jgi:hypothetical protein